MKKRMCLLAICALIPFSVSSSFAAIQIYFGEDLRNGAILPLAAYPNAAAAEAEFLSNLVGVGTETFEGIADGTKAALSLNFPGAGTATLSGGSGLVTSLLQGQATPDGRYGITNDGGNENYFDVAAGGAGSFVVTFSQPIAAFGFYGIDIGDFGGELKLQTAGGSNSLMAVPHTATSSSEGAVLFFGFITTTALETVTSVSFRTSTGMGDYFGFDDFTIASLAQVQPPAQPQAQPPVTGQPKPPIVGNPEPVGLILWGTLFGLAGAFTMLRRNRTGQN